VNSSYAETQWRNFLAMYSAGRRNLKDPSALSVFYDNIPDMPSDEVSRAFNESVDYRISKDLPVPDSSTFASQISARSAQATFTGIVNEMGVETEYSEDVTSEVVSRFIPDISGLEDTIQELVRKGFKINEASLASRFPVVAEDKTILHIEEKAPSVWVEEQAFLRMRRRRAEAYVQSYVGG
jgi:hypothetical protein